MSYWGCAFKLARASTKTFGPWKAIPSVLAALALWFFSLKTMTEILPAIGAAVASYALCYAGDFIWKLLVVAPVSIYGETQKEITTLREDVSALKLPRRPPSDVVKLREIRSLLLECENRDLEFLKLLARRPEFKHDELKLACQGRGLSEAEFSAAYQKFKEFGLILHIPTSAIRQYNALQINPEYKPLLLELLYAE
jgi:hypothetical protein